MALPGFIRHAVEDALDVVFPKSRIRVTPRMRELLERAPVCVIDAGGAMGPDARWAPLRPALVRLMTFEPDGRSLEALPTDASSNDLTLGIGLAEAPGERTLHLTAGPPEPACRMPERTPARRAIRICRVIAHQPRNDAGCC